jgi:hypothetical protein
MSTPEGRLKEEVIGELKKLGIFYLRTNSGVVKVRGGFIHLAPIGTADLLVFKGMQPYWIELKGLGQTTHRKRAEAQQAFAEEVEALGHYYRKCDSLTAVIEFLEGM